MALITREQFKVHDQVVGDDLDPVIDALIPACGAAFDRYCRRKLEAATYTEDHSGDGGPRLFLRHFPINSITSILISDTRDFAGATALPAADYVLDSEAGIVERVDSTGLDLLRQTSPGWPLGRYNIRVDYSGGFAAVPSDLQEAALLWVSWRIRRSGAIGVSSDTTGEHTVTFGQRRMPADIEEILSRYRAFPNLAGVRSA